MNSFPEGFVWGAATASYQIEGGVAEGGRAPSIWDTFTHTPGTIADGTTGDIACDHYHRYAEDLDLLAALGVTHYRFSLAWPRIQPSGSGQVNQEGMDFYARLIDGLIERNIQPWVTLYHWDLPQALEDKGGWPVRDTALRFADYAAATYERLADRVTYWTTLNEPWCSAYLGYGTGTHAPGRREPAAALRAAHHLLLGHGLAVRRMRAISSSTENQIGITLNLWPIAPDSQAPADVDAARRVDGISNRFFLDPVLRGRYPADVLRATARISGDEHLRADDEQTIGAPIDFLGVNYYMPNVVRARPADEPVPADHSTAWIGCDDVEQVSQGLPRTDMGWEIEPDGLRRLLVRLHSEYPAIPLYVTENGIALRDVTDTDGRVQDPERIAYLDQHLRACLRSIDEGVDLRGYFVWTLTDNFEWSWGFTRKFGLVHLDPATQRRVPKASAQWYTKVARENALPSVSP